MEKKEKVLINQIPDLVLFDFNVKPLSRLVWSFLNSLSWEKGYCYASNSFIAGKFQVHEITISNSISELESNGYIKIFLDKNEPNNTKRKIYIENITSNSNGNKKPLTRRVLVEKLIPKTGGGISENAKGVLAKTLRGSKRKHLPGISENAKQVVTLSSNNSSNSTAVTQKNVSLTQQPSSDCEVTGEPVSLEVKGKGEVLTNNELNAENMQETPSQQQVIEFFNSNGIGQEPATYWFNKLSKANWLDSGGQKIAHWRNYALYYINGLKSKQTPNQPLTSNGQNQPVTSQIETTESFFRRIAKYVAEIQHTEAGHGRVGFEDGIYGLLLEAQNRNNLTPEETQALFIQKCKHITGSDFEYQNFKTALLDEQHTHQNGSNRKA